MVITLLTDFGLSDPYVGVMKGVILNICPASRIVDITHDIPPQCVDMASFVLGKSYPYFPAGSIHCIVVDPGVGSDRKILVAATDQYMFIAPDNGVLEPVFCSAGDCMIYQVTASDYFLPDVSCTFHGRDIFAPVAAHLAKGIRPEQVGEPVRQVVRLQERKPVISQNRITGEVIFCDRFGNAVTNIHFETLKNRGNFRIILGSYSIEGLQSAYSDVKAGQPLAIIGSYGNLEIAVREGSACSTLGINPGDKINIEFSISESH